LDSIGVGQQKGLMSNSGIHASSAPVERVISQSRLMMYLNRAKIVGQSP